MKNRMWILLLGLLGFNLWEVKAQEQVVVEPFPQGIVIRNNQVSLSFNLEKGIVDIQDRMGDKIVESGYFQLGGLQSRDHATKRSYISEEVQDVLGKGKSIIVKTEYAQYSNILWKATLYQDQAYIILEMGIENDEQKPYQLMNFHPLITKRLYAGKDNAVNYRILDGNGGGSPTRVTDTTALQSFNNVLVRFGDLKKPNILVAGGITYHEFEKFVSVSRGDKVMTLDLMANDPVGRKIDAGTTYWPKERFYLNIAQQNPFEALEEYGRTLKKAQEIELNYYDFPTECLWYAAFYNTDSVREKFNNSKGAVEEMDNAIKSGITKYTKVGIRLVPDAYGANNQQGWWDDEHWAMYNEPMSTNEPHYVAPYLKTEQWTKAILDKGGYPFTYMQSGRRSEDFVLKHPDWMLFNDPYRAYSGNQVLRLLQESSYPNPFGLGYSRQWWSEKQLWGYDFTDKGFMTHMRAVYKRLKDAGVKGIFYDYPENTAWAYEGGFDDPYATTAQAYRNMFLLAREGLGKEALLQERNIVRGSDLTLGLVSSQRVWADTDGITPEMVSYCGLRWYKNRVVINYDMDSKDPSDALPKEYHDGNRSMLTMTYVTSGRFLLGRSFAQLTPEQIHDLSRTFPYHSQPQSARPIDAFNKGVEVPRVYDYAVNPDWHQLTFYNYNQTADATKNTISVALSASLNEGGLQLDDMKDYYVYDFWNDRLVGLLNGKNTLEQQLRAGEARMMSIHAKKDVPQFISTNRHLMQGYLDLKDCQWEAKGRTLTGVSDVIEGDPYEVVIANNGHRISKVNLSDKKSSVKFSDIGNRLVKLTIESDRSQQVKWSVKYK